MFGIKNGRGPLKVGVVAKIFRTLCAQLYLQPHHIKIPRSAPVLATLPRCFGHAHHHGLA